MDQPALCTLASVTFTISTLIIAYLVYKVVVNHEKTKTTVMYSGNSNLKGYKVMIGCNSCGLVSFLIVSGSYMLILWVAVAGSHYGHRTISLLTEVTFTFYLIGIWIMLFIFVSRINYNFKSSFLAYPPLIINILYGAVYFIALDFLLVIILSVAAQHEHIQIWLAPLTLILHFSFSVILMYLLCRKVYQTMHLRMTQSITNDVDHEEEEEDETMNRNEENLVDLDSIKSFTRYAMLVTIGIISTYFGNVIVVFGFGIDDILRCDRIMLYALDGTVNALCLYFLFHFTGNQYYKLCGICHSICERCCVECLWQCTKQKRTGKTKQEFIELILTET